MTAAACADVDPAIFEADDPAPAIRVCLRCPVLFACRWWALHNNVAGVVGGVTERQRREWRKAWNVTVNEPPASLFLDDKTLVADEIGPGRAASQLVADLIAHRTAQGQSAHDIAEAVGLAQRSVVRYRAMTDRSAAS